MADLQTVQSLSQTRASMDAPHVEIKGYRQRREEGRTMILITGKQREQRPSHDHGYRQTAVRTPNHDLHDLQTAARTPSNDLHYRQTVITTPSHNHGYRQTAVRTPSHDLHYRQTTGRTPEA
ncbi:hypothetical protein SUGI_0814850 [Cryptomeria japonica]|nr:hypothetical protein SUGI_0814850 [Cryptomeria japonica]